MTASAVSLMQSSQEFMSCTRACEYMCMQRRTLHFSQPVTGLSGRVHLAVLHAFTYKLPVMSISKQ